MKYSNIQEEEIKNKITQDFFSQYDCTKILGKIDFAVKLKRPANTVDFSDEYLLWAEAKQKPTDILVMLSQLVLTIGKARTFDEILPPPFLGCYDNEKIAFVPYSDVQDIFYQNDFNWKVAPSNHEKKEFKQVYTQIKYVLDNEIPWETYVFNFETDEKELKRFIRENFIVGKKETSKTRIDKNNFNIIYSKWRETVMPTININWELAKKANIIDGDFYLADLLSSENESFNEKLFVLLKSDHYKYNREKDELGEMLRTVYFKDNQKAYTQFWAKYKRPPSEDYWDHIMDHRHLLVPQDVRERKGSFYTPKIWVELSQKYLADVFGEDWQEEYYVWDCAAGTGNLLVGLKNKYHLFASTLDKQDVAVMHQRIENGANLVKDHVFQFDFLNDGFSKLPQSLQDIINNPKKRKKLIIYINPPYAEASSYGVGSISQVATETKIFKAYKNSIGAEAVNELFAQFFIRIYKEIPDSFLASFSTPKFVTSEKFTKFRNVFKAEFQKGFICPSYTFDNVPGKFPISFLIWDLAIKNEIKHVKTTIFDSIQKDKKIVRLGNKRFSIVKDKSIGKWRETFYSDKDEMPIGFMIIVGPSMQSSNNTFITSEAKESYKKKGMVARITATNLIEMSIYFSIRKCIKQTWLNNRDQFLYPNEGWKDDLEFQNDCLTYALFNNNIRAEIVGKSKQYVNNWIPFTEYEVGAKSMFMSNFMTDFIAGKAVEPENIASEMTLFYGCSPNDSGYSGGGRSSKPKNIKREFTKEAKDVFNAGRLLWKYYHEQPNCNVNASLYDIREHFQGRNSARKMNNKSDDAAYNELNGNLREALKALAEKIEPKVYEYGFLKK